MRLAVCRAWLSGVAKVYLDTVEYRLSLKLHRPLEDVLSRACAKGFLRWSDDQGLVALV